MSDTHDFIIATYREIAERFGLGDSRTARNKAKRAGWVHEPVNHPADPRRVRVPRDSWNEAVNPRVRQAEPQGSGVQTVHEHQGSTAQMLDEHEGSEVQTKDEHRGSHDSDYGGSDPQTNDEHGGVKTDRQSGGPKRRPPRDHERDAQRIRDLEAMVGLLKEQLARERERADVSDTRVAELTAKLIALTERRTTMVEQMTRAARAGRTLLLRKPWWRFPRA